MVMQASQVRGERTTGDEDERLENANDGTTAATRPNCRASGMTEISHRPFGTTTNTTTGQRECELGGKRSLATDKSLNGAQQQPQQQPAVARSLPMLDYYLTFIHYFGFSINPNDDTNSRYLSIRVKRAAAFASSMRLHRQNQRLRKQTSGTTDGGDEDSASSVEDAETSDESPADRKHLAAAAAQQQRDRQRAAGSRKCRKRLRLTVKFLAIALTSFLAFNHLVVLIDYVRQGSKVLTELLLEMRLVITKFSALIFVVTWHRNQARVRQLIRLVKSTSVNILAREAHLQARISAGMNQRDDHPQPQQQHQQVAVENPRLRSINRRILTWWLLCTSVTLVHFSLSEAEIKTADHLWEWLDDYSLHTLSNATTSTASLFVMASFDNYIYTVHVYGTRLIGASIICIVCTFQVENIDCLTRHALGLLQASQTAHMRIGNNDKQQHPAQKSQSNNNNNNNNSWSWWWPTIWGSLDSALGANDPRGPNRAGVGACGLLRLDWAQQRQLCRSFYVLGESDWLQVERERHRLEPLGWLSSSLSARQAELVQANASALCVARRCLSLARSFWQRQRQSIFGAPCCTITNRVTPFGGLFAKGWRRRRARSQPREGSPGEHPTQLGEPDKHDNSLPAGCAGALPENLAENSHERAATASTLRDYFNDYLARERTRGNIRCGGRAPPPPMHRQLERGAGGGGDDGDNEGITQSMEASERKHGKLSMSHHHPQQQQQQQQMMMMMSGQEVELQLDSLARKYELIRTVNLRIDHCFGHILLSQYLFLFLMSCIDVVFFSLSFSTNTKTKYIIVSGMILLWLPYLLLYRYASDIGLASERLLTSVRRLARLALVLQLSAGDAGGESHTPGGAGTNVAPSGGPPSDGEQVAVAAAAVVDDKLANWSLSGLGQESNFAFFAPRPGGLGFWPASTLWHYRHLFCRQPFVDLDKKVDCPSQRLITAPARQVQPQALASDRTTTRRLVQANPPPLVPPSPQPTHKVHDWPNTTTTASTATSGGVCSSRARIFNKLDHVFKPSHLSIVGIMTMNKFFLLDFAKIVITASVMTIQFITKR